MFGEVYVCFPFVIVIDGTFLLRWLVHFLFICLFLCVCVRVCTFHWIWMFEVSSYYYYYAFPLPCLCLDFSFCIHGWNVDKCFKDPNFLCFLALLVVL